MKCVYFDSSNLTFNFEFARCFFPSFTLSQCIWLRLFCVCVCFFVLYFTYSLPLFLVPCIRNSLFICSFLFLLQINLIILFDQSIQRQTKSTNKLFVCLWICAFCCVQCFLFCIGNGNGNGNGNSKANGNRNRNVMAKHCIAWHGMALHWKCFRAFCFEQIV